MVPSHWRMNPLVIVRRLADDLVAVGQLSLEGSELSNSARSLDLQDGAIDGSIDLRLSAKSTDQW